MISQYVRGLPHNCEVIQWIPVSERLPERARNYQVTINEPQCDNFFTTKLYYYEGKWWDEPYGIEYHHEVIAWAELPKGYRP